MLQQITNGTSALKIEYFDIFGIEINQEVEDYRSGAIPKNKVLETFKRVDKLPFSGLDIKFSDNVWDFTSATTLPISPDLLTYRFNENSKYVDYLKMYVLNEIIKKKCKIRSLHNKYGTVVKCVEAFEQEGYTNLARVPKTAVKHFFEQKEDEISYNTLCAYKGHLLMFVEFYERTFEELTDQSIKKYLADRNTSRINSIKEANKTPEVPVEYFPIFLDGVKTIMRDTSKSDEDRITAASIILFSQIGFRTSELFTVKINSVNSVWSPDKEKPLYYMEFKSHKHGTGEDGSTVGRTYINALSHEAYDILMTLCKENRELIGSDMLFVSKGQKGMHYSARNFSERYRKFIMRHWKELQCLNIGDEYEDLESFEVQTYFKPAKDGTYTYDKESEWAKPLRMTDRIYFPTIRQFRVSVCTSLYRQQVPLYYIKKHMNHLSEDMAAYYIRPKKNLEKEYSETVYRAVFQDGSKMLGQNGDAFIQKINEFIAQNNLNIKDNMEEVIQTVAKKFPLRSKVGGMCIRCGEVIPCASNSSTDVIYCAFGMCPNHCHMFFMADISYEEYLQHIDVVKYNQENGFKKAYQKELNKLKYVIENSLMPELVMFEEEIQKHGEDEILDKYPQLTYIVQNYETIKQEVSAWM